MTRNLLSRYLGWRSLMPLALPLFLIAPAILQAQDPDVIIISDRPGDEHGLRRETRIEIAPGAAGKTSYAVKQEIFPEATLLYSKEGLDPYLAPLILGGISVYPSSYSTQFKNDSLKDGGKLIRMVSFDEEVDILLEGQFVSSLLPNPTGPRKIAEVKLPAIPPKRPTSAWLGLSAPQLIQRTLPAGLVGYSQAVTLPNGKRTYIGNWVVKVDKGGPAETAGIQVGDVLVELAGEKLTRQRQAEMVADFLELGRSVPCVVLRRVGKDVQALTLKITPGRKNP